MWVLFTGGGEQRGCRVAGRWGHRPLRRGGESRCDGCAGRRERRPLRAGIGVGNAFMRSEIGTDKCVPYGVGVRWDGVRRGGNLPPAVFCDFFALAKNVDGVTQSGTPTIPPPPDGGPPPFTREAWGKSTSRGRLGGMKNTARRKAPRGGVLTAIIRR